MWQLTACKKSVSLRFLTFIKNEMFLYRISEVMLQTLIKKYDKKSFHFYPVQKRETNWNFTGCQVPRFMIVLIFFKPFLDNKMSVLRTTEPLMG